MDLTAIRDMSVAAVALVVVYFMLRNLFRLLGGFIKDVGGALRDNATALRELREWLQSQEINQIERENRHMQQIHNRFDRVDSKLENLHDATTSLRIQR